MLESFSCNGKGEGGHGGRTSMEVGDKELGDGGRGVDWLGHWDTIGVDGEEETK